MTRAGGRRVWPYLWALLIVALSIGGLRLAPAIDNGGAAPVLLLAVLVVARTWQTGPALLASASAALGYSYFFFAPAGPRSPFGFGLEDPNDWAALITFTISAMIVGELAGRAKRRHLEAQAGQREIERLYRELQAAFDRASEAEAARRNEQLKAALLDALTHNLRTPLTAIKASVTALLDARHWNQPEALTNEGREELLQIIDEESDRLNRFIEALSAADRPEVAEPLSLRSVRLDKILRAGLTRAETVARDHRVETEVEPSIPPLAVDAPSVAEVIYILLDNASKYSPPGTVIRVRASVEDSRHVRIAVEDQGPGIPAGFRERVFEQFFRIPGREPADSRRPNGIGLGLPIARRLVEAQAGRIWIETPSSGSGTAVVFTLPFSEELQPVNASAPLALTG
jgi:two-component system sensor histidine kinase KdpD